MTKKETLNKLVIAEAKQLKVNAKKSELKRLNFESLKPNKIDMCIYGQMTSDCNSSRAVKLMELSCEKVYRNTTSVFGNITGVLGGSPKNESRATYWSPIEIFIAKRSNEKNGNNERLIAFLKDETKTLKLK